AAHHPGPRGRAALRPGDQGGDGGGGGQQTGDHRPEQTDPGGGENPPPPGGDQGQNGGGPRRDLRPDVWAIPVANASCLWYDTLTMKGKRSEALCDIFSPSWPAWPWTRE